MMKQSLSSSFSGFERRGCFHPPGLAPWLTSAAFFLFSLLPDPVFALQSHGHPEGLYVHQMAHILFALAMLALLIFLRIQPLGQGRGWTYFRLSLVFFFFWNIDAFVTHWIAEGIPEEAIVGRGHLTRYISSPTDLWTWIYYIGKFDHLLCVPGMLFLTLALRTFYFEAKERSIKKNGEVVAP